MTKTKLTKADKEREKLAKQLAALPFDHAFPAIKRAVNQDYRLMFTKALSDWCARHVKAVVAYAEEQKQIDKHNDAYNRGFEDAKRNLTHSANPYGAPGYADAWRDGWTDGMRAMGKVTRVQ